MAKCTHTGYKKILHNAWSIFLNGLFTLLPVTLTIALFRFSFKLLKGWLQPIEQLIERTFLIDIPHSEILIVILFIFFVGLVLHFFFLKQLIHGLEELIFRIPLVRPVYSGIKQLVAAFNIKEDSLTIKRVVLVEFPHDGIYSVGFLTGELPQELAPTQEEKYFNVFIPTTPNPTTGFYIIIPEKKLIEVNLTRQEGMSLIISGGIILPERFGSRAKAPFSK
jgi:uncharacterized membrane protein